MAGEKARVKWVVNCSGEPTAFTEMARLQNHVCKLRTCQLKPQELSKGNLPCFFCAPFQESILDVNATIREIKELVFAQEIARGLSVRVIFLGRELADSDALASHLRLSARAAAAGPCATSSSAAAQDAPGVTLHAVISSRPPNAGSGGAGDSTAGGGGTEDGDWSVLVLGVTVLVILCICWYHRLAFPADFTPLSSLLLLLFTGFYAFTVRGVVLRIIKLAFGCLRHPWRVREGSTRSTRPAAPARSFQELAQRPPG